MKINIFEGARRIAKLSALAWVICWIVAAFNYSPYVSVNYTFPFPGESPVRKTEPCPYEGATDYTTKSTSKGTTVSVFFCFQPRKASNGTFVVPYRYDSNSGQWFGNSSISTEVRDYTRRVIREFEIPPRDEQAIEEDAKKKYWEEFVHGFAFAVGGLIAFWGFVWTIGWVVRGFAGIPNGKDQRENSRQE